MLAMARHATSGYSSFSCAGTFFGGLSDDFNAADKGPFRRLVLHELLRLQTLRLSDQIVCFVQDMAEILKWRKWHPPPHPKYADPCMDLVPLESPVRPDAKLLQKKGELHKVVKCLLSGFELNQQVYITISVLLIVQERPKQSEPPHAEGPDVRLIVTQYG